MKRFIFLLPVAFLFACSVSKQKAATTVNSQVHIPVVSEVGALALPDEIAPVTAPFPMPQFKKPTFPSLSISIIEKGAKEGIKNTGMIQAAIDEVNRRGGGTVIVPAGKWNTGRISLKSNVNLHLAEGAELHFSGEVEDYRPAVFTRHEGIEVMSLGACIYAYQQENIALTGKGKLVGPSGGSIKKQMMTQDVVENVVPYNKPVSERVYEGYNGDFIFLPMFVSPTSCKNVYIEGITLEHTPFWNIVPVYCDGVIIRGITVNSVGVPRGDGIDIESSRNVLIEYSTLSCGDDCFTMKSGRDKDGVRVNKPTENVVVRYCLAREGHGGITVGSETAGMIRNLYVHDCVFDDTGVGIRFKTRRPRGGGGENLYYERIRMNLRDDAFNWDMLGGKQYVGDLAVRLPAREINSLTPVFKNIEARNIIVEKAKYFIKVKGIPESPLTNVLIEQADISCKNLFTAHDIKDITLRNLNIQSQDSLISILDGRNVIFEKVRFNVPGNAIVTDISGPLSQNIKFENSTPQKPKGWENTVWSR
ncbi:glycoside hydrolase family 28 protein [Chitinophagaceae bacterium LB-8]|uniref:Glycoside hydrolase family 28 protein n=1 Tax=Paraflavisolibacter caeni TaxID=2982496 RepID=A0A9X3BAH4_9BACT|nr:glycoside hydrolase family 28 protein [Paraflavisolibacter caeni]MCU7552786.1 glycoside hydrolase family 28 protein [Paraflavisolibacter caeni]